MKKILSSIVLCVGLLTNAQQKKAPLVSPDFWKSSPSLEQVKSEVSKGFDFKNINGFDDPILVAILNGGDNAAIKYLLDQPNVDIHRQFFHQRTYLHLAANTGNEEIAAYLIQKGADIHRMDDNGLTPMVYGAAGGKLKPSMVDLFIKHGLDLKEVYKQQNDVNLLLLVIGYDKDLVVTDYLISKGLSLDSKDKNGSGAFNYVTRNGSNHMNNLKELVKRGVKYDDTALLWAAQGMHRNSNGIELYKYLIEELKLNPKVTNPKGETLLHYIASRPNQDEVIAYLISKGVDASKKNADGDTAFSLATSGKSVNAVKALLSYAKDINAKSSNGETPLSNAIKRSNAEVVAFLLQNGADINFVDKHGNGAAYALVESYHAPRRGETTDEFTPKLQLLVQKGIDFAKPFKDGSTVYHIAATKNELPLFDKLKGIKANVNAKNEDGLTALHKSALVSKDDKALKLLISMGADKSIKTDLGETVYDLAKENEVFKKNNVNIEFLK